MDVDSEGVLFKKMELFIFFFNQKHENQIPFVRGTFKAIGLHFKSRFELSVARTKQFSAFFTKLATISRSET